MKSPLGRIRQSGWHELRAKVAGLVGTAHAKVKVRRSHCLRNRKEEDNEKDHKMAKARLNFCVFCVLAASMIQGAASAALNREPGLAYEHMTFKNSQCCDVLFDLSTPALACEGGHLSFADEIAMTSLCPSPREPCKGNGRQGDNCVCHFHDSVASACYNSVPFNATHPLQVNVLK